MYNKLKKILSSIDKNIKIKDYILEKNQIAFDLGQAKFDFNKKILICDIYGFEKYFFVNEKNFNFEHFENYVKKILDYNSNLFGIKKRRFTNL